MSQKRPREEIQTCATTATISQSCLDTMYIEKHRQKDALAICDMSPGAMVFALDLKKGAGAKTFVVAGFKAFWTRYSRASARRCHYEVIRPGMPCKFYMDIDVDFIGMRDGDHVVRELRLKIPFFDVVFFDFVEFFIEIDSIERSILFYPELFTECARFKIGVSLPNDVVNGRAKPNLQCDEDIPIYHRNLWLNPIVVIRKSFQIAVKNKL